MVGEVDGGMPGSGERKSPDGLKNRVQKRIAIKVLGSGYDKVKGQLDASDSADGDSPKAEAFAEFTKDNDAETDEQKAAREAQERAEAEKAAAERLEQIKNALADFAIKWKEAIAKQVLDGESADMPEFPPHTEPPITEDEIKKYYTEKNSSKNYEEARRVEMAFYKAENNEKVINQLKQLVAEMPPTDPNKKRGDKLAEAAKANARQLVEDLLDGVIKGGEFTQAILSDGKRHKIRLSLGLPEGKSVREVTEFDKLMQGEGLDKAFGKTGPGFYRVGDVAGYVTHGNVIAAGDKPQINNMREALGTERYDDFDSGYLKAYLTGSGVSNPGGNLGQNYWSSDGLSSDKEKNRKTDDDKGYGANFNGNTSGGAWISTGDLFAAVFTSGPIETAVNEDVLIGDYGVLDDEEDSSAEEEGYEREKSEAEKKKDERYKGLKNYLERMSTTAFSEADYKRPEDSAFTSSEHNEFVSKYLDETVYLHRLTDEGEKLLDEYIEKHDVYGDLSDDKNRLKEWIQEKERSEKASSHISEPELSAQAENNETDDKNKRHDVLEAFLKENANSIFFYSAAWYKYTDYSTDGNAVAIGLSAYGEKLIDDYMRDNERAVGISDEDDQKAFKEWVREKIVKETPPTPPTYSEQPPKNEETKEEDPAKKEFQGVKTEIKKYLKTLEQSILKGYLEKFLKKEVPAYGFGALFNRKKIVPKLNDDGEKAIEDFFKSKHYITYKENPSDYSGWGLGDMFVAWCADQSKPKPVAESNPGTSGSTEKAEPEKAPAVQGQTGRMDNFFNSGQ